MHTPKGFIPLVVTITIVLVAILMVVAVWVVKNENNEGGGSITYPTQEECERAAGCTCAPLLCDVNCPKDFQKGWACVSKNENNKINTNLETCQQYYDGCNTCVRMDYGVSCTERYCEPDEYEDAYCLDEAITNTTTATWQTVAYAEGGYNFSLEILNDWEYLPWPNYDQERQSLLTVYDAEGGNTAESLSISFYRNPTGSLADWVTEHKLELERSHEAILTDAPFVADPNRHVIISDMKEVFTHAYCYVQSDEIVYSLYFFSEKDHWTQYEEIFNHACETFQVSSAATDTSDWQTYENEQHGYTVQYPADYTASGGSNRVTLQPTDNPGGNQLVIFRFTGANNASFSQEELEWYSYARNDSYPNTLYFDRQATLIGGKTFTAFTFDPGSTGGFQYFFADSDDVWLIHDARSPSTNTINDQILATVQFST